MKNVLTLVAITTALTACAHKALNQPKREPGSDPQIEQIDPKFEQPWGGNLTAEEASLKKLGQTIGTFVAHEADQNRKWKAELQTLQAQNPAHLSKSKQQRMKAIQLILNDLPQRETWATRDVHRRPQACLNASLTVRSDLPSEDNQGLFQPSAHYDAIVRFSNGNPRNLPDYAPDARGMAVKLLKKGVLSQELSASALNEQGLLDLLTINFPVFFMNDPDHYTGVNEAFLAVSKNPEAALDPGSFYFKFYEFLSVFAQGLSAWEKNLALEVNGSIISNPLHEKYWSMMSYRLGDSNDPARTAIKYIWAPCAENLPAGGAPEWTRSHDYSKPRLPLLGSNPYDAIPKELQKELSAESGRYYLRKNLFTDLAGQSADSSSPKKCFELQIQRYVDEQSTPVEDTTHIWLENAEQKQTWAEKFAKEGGSGLTSEKRRNQVLSWNIAAPVTIARLEFDRVPAQESQAVLSGASSNSFLCEDLSFNPWNNVLSAHKPLGIVGRMRKPVYSASRHTRHGINGVNDSQAAADH